MPRHLENSDVNKMSREILPEGWFHATEEESNKLWQELQRELPPGHILFNEPIQVVAHRDGANDDILCKH